MSAAAGQNTLKLLPMNFANSSVLELNGLVRTAISHVSCTTQEITRNSSPYSQSPQRNALYLVGAQ